MDFEFLDSYLLDGSPAKAQVVQRLLATASGSAAAAPFFEGMRLLGERTPDLSLLALRLVLAGKRADDASVVRLREVIARARLGGVDSPAARSQYHAELSA